MAIKLCERTDGAHTYMRLILDSGRTEKIDAYSTSDEWRYCTSSDDDSGIRQQVIQAFHELHL